MESKSNRNIQNNGLLEKMIRVLYVVSCGITLLSIFFSAFVLSTSAMSAECTNSLQVLLSYTVDNSCNSSLSAIFLNVSMFDLCTSNINDIECMNPYSVIAATEDSLIVSPWQLTESSSCILCEPDASMYYSCSSILDEIMAIISTQQYLYTDSAFNIPSVLYSDLTLNISTFCSDDYVTIAQLRHQGNIVCASGSTFGNSVTSVNTLNNVMDMRYLTQCGSCGMIPCLNGQYCPLNTPPRLCRGGYYCPTPDTEIICPADYYCPQGSTFPIKCHAFASGSCREGSAREVVWIPLLWSVLLIVMSYGVNKWVPFMIALQGKENGRSNQQLSHKNHQHSTTNQFNLGASSVNTSQLQVGITFKDIVLVTNGNMRLSGVSGVIRPGKFCAIVGASGCGKTTLMRTLMGKETPTSGSIQYVEHNSNTIISRSLLKRSIGFVPQDDILLREMTVRQLVTQSANWRLPISMTKEEKNAFVDLVLQTINLSKLQNVVVGGGESTMLPISAGDRKCVNIAVEIVSQPLCIFLDEPTTNLDASSALNVTKIINQLSIAQMTCVAVIHQPRREIFALIDDLILLVPGGKIAYSGPVNRVLDWFRDLGFTPAKPSISTADFIIDLTSGNPDVYDKSFYEAHHKEAKSDDTIDWAELWSKYGSSFIRDTNSSLTVAHDGGSEALGSKIVNDSFAHVPIVSDREKPGFLPQLFESLQIAVLQHLKENRLIVDCVYHLIAGCILGLVTAGGVLLLVPLPTTYTQSCPPEASPKCVWFQRYQLGPATFYMASLFAAVVIPSAVRTFGREFSVLKRNYDVGANLYSYFIGKMVIDYLFGALKAMLFVAPIIAIAPWTAPFEYLLAIFICLSIYLNSFCYLLSLLFSNPDVAILFGTVYCIPINLLGGFVPLLGDGYHAYVFHPKWVARAIATAELHYGQKLSIDLINSFVPESWKYPDLGKDLGILCAMAIGLNIVSIVMLYLKMNRSGN